MLKTIYLAADNVSGIYKIDPNEFPEMEVMKIYDFIESLPTLSDGEVVYTVFTAEDEKIYRQLDEECGIH